MTNDKQRLAKLVEEANREAWNLINMSCCEEKLKLLDKVNEIRADYLLANGVIVPPCKVGDTVYVLEDWGYEKELEEKEVDVIAIAGTDDFSKELWGDVYGGVIGTFSDVGKTVFLSKEEAEQALNNVQNGNSCEGGASDAD